MRADIERGSGTATNIIVAGFVVALGFGLLAGVSVVRHAIDAVRTAEQHAVAVATRLAAGDSEPCVGASPPIVRCSVNARAVSVTVELHGTRATATAGPER